MNTLFTIQRSFHSGIWLYEQLAFANQGDSIILLQDAVLALASPILLASFTAKASANNIALCALKYDIDLHGIQNQYKSISIINYEDFVTLSVKHSKHVAW